jgi:cytochrome c-type biogenesis protein CcmH/NrfG
VLVQPDLGVEHERERADRRDCVAPLARPDVPPRPRGARVIARAVILLAALAGAAALTADLRTTREVDRAVAAAAAPSRLDASIATLRDVGAGTSDTTPLFRQAQLLLGEHDYRGAQAAALTAARREPENAQAWLLVGFAAAGSGDRAAEVDARRRINELVARP